MSANGITLLILVSIALALLVLIGISDDHATVDEPDFNVVCLDGVEYWFRRSGYGQILAVKMTSEGTVVLCE
jgi:hypothetical protein